MRLLSGALLVVLVACGNAKDARSVACLDVGKQAIGHVGACDLGMTSYRYAVLLAGERAARGRALAALVDRELLAQAALEAGDTPASSGDLLRRVAAGDVRLLGAPMEHAPWVVDGGFDKRALDDFVGSLSITIDDFAAEQGRELLADKMRQRIAGTPPDPGKVLAWLAKRCHDLAARGQITLESAAAGGYQPCAPP
jgi:hypothetical protein